MKGQNFFSGRRELQNRTSPLAYELKCSCARKTRQLPCSFFLLFVCLPRRHDSENSFKCFHAFQIELKFESVGFSGEDIKPEYQEKILSEQEWEPTTNSTHKWRRRRETNPHHTGGRRVLSSLGHPCSTPSPSPLLTFVSRSLGNASHAGYVFAVWKTTC